MDTEIIHRVCLSCETLHEGVEISNDVTTDLKYSHCANCFEDYDQFRDATMNDLVKHRGKKLSKILLQ